MADLPKRGERVLAEFFENACVSLRWINRHAHTLRVNQARDMLASEREEVVGRRISDFHIEQPLAANPCPFGLGASSPSVSRQDVMVEWHETRRSHQLQQPLYL